MTPVLKTEWGFCFVEMSKRTFKGVECLRD